VPGQGVHAAFKWLYVLEDRTLDAASQLVFRGYGFLCCVKCTLVRRDRPVLSHELAVGLDARERIAWARERNMHCARTAGTVEIRDRA
jgi:hypothetical protein